MERKKVTVLEIIYGLLLKFGKVNELDVNVLVQKLKKKFDVEVDLKNKHYFVTQDGFIILNPTAIDSMLKQINNRKLENNQNVIVKSYLDNLSLTELVLRKIKLCGWTSIEKDDVLNNFDISQIIELKRLIKNGYLIVYWEPEDIYDDFLAVKLTQKGEVELFLIDNSRKIDAFFQNLGIKCNNSKTKIDFLMTQDLSLATKDILNVDNFISFCRDYDRPYPSGHKLKRSPRS
ncbi:MAG: hypothetical protein IJE89_03925 [Bacilli bacterium]|nr:hypothetical protein [Bacilli bacterium]